MAINYSEENKDGKLRGILQVDNGDLQALRDVMEQYGFVNEEALIRYALVALLKATDNKLYIKQDSNILSMKIAENLLKKPNPPKNPNQ